MSILGFFLPAPIPSAAPRSRTSRGCRSRLRIGSAAVTLLALLSCGQVARAVEPSGPTMAQVETQRGTSPKARAKLLVAKGAVLGGVLGIAVQIGLAIGLAPASAGGSNGTSRRPDPSPRMPSSRTAALAPESDAPARPTRRSNSTAPDHSDQPRPRGRKRRPGSRHTIVPKAGSPINISINTYPYYPTGAQPMPWQMPAEGFRPGIQISPSESPATTVEPTRQAAHPAASVFPPVDSRPASPGPVFSTPAATGSAFTGPQRRVPVGLETDADTAVWKQGFERVHRPKSDQPNAHDPKSVSSVEGMMQKIVAENLSLRG